MTLEKLFYFGVIRMDDLLFVVIVNVPPFVQVTGELEAVCVELALLVGRQASSIDHGQSDVYRIDAYCSCISAGRISLEVYFTVGSQAAC
jgi:hypothetical protein